MGVISAGLGCGTTVYFELPLFSATAAGKAPTTPTIAARQTLLPDRIARQKSILSRDQNSLHAVLSTPQKMKPIVSTTTTPLSGSKVVISGGSALFDDAEDSSPSPRIFWKPKRGIFKQFEDLEIAFSVDKIRCK